MRDIRLHVDTVLAVGAEIALPAEAARHAASVLRLRAGATVWLFDGRGGEYRAELVRVARGEVRARVEEHRPVARESPLPLTLVQGVSRGERMDLAIQKSVELGVGHVQPVLCARSVVRLDAGRAARRTAHWQSVATAACEQSGRDRVPRVAPPLDFEDWLAAAPAAGLRLTLSPAAGRVLDDLPAPGTDGAILVVGPEGGLAPPESRALAAAGFLPLRLGPRVLRTETAAMAAITALQLRFGDLGRPAAD